MVAILREADSTSVGEVAKKHKVSEASIYAWRKHFGQLEAADVKRLKALELENGRLKKLLRGGARHRGAQGDQRKKVVIPQSRHQQVDLACQRVCPSGEPVG